MLPATFRKGTTSFSQTSTMLNNNSTPIKLAIIDSYGEPLKSFLQKYFIIDFVQDFHQADYLIYGDFGFNHASFHGVKIFITGENHKANLRACDYALTHERQESERCFRLPYWMQWIFSYEYIKEQLLQPRQPLHIEDIKREPRKFCNFIYRNHVCKTRNRFYKHLSKYKKIDSPGPLFNNMSTALLNEVGKFNFQKNYRFSIAFENKANPGYQTEKLMDALMSRSVPIYWGNTFVAEDFNPAAFINYNDFPDEKALIEYIIKVDNDDNLLLSYLNQPIFLDDQFISKKEQELALWFSHIFSSKQQHRSQKDKIMFWTSQFYGHPFFYHLRRISRCIRRKLKNKTK
ncbi:MAG: glycosyltransferase family 10 [Akkermansia sp.]